MKKLLAVAFIACAVQGLLLQAGPNANLLTELMIGKTVSSEKLSELLPENSVLRQSCEIMVIQGFEHAGALDCAKLNNHFYEIEKCIYSSDLRILGWTEKNINEYFDTHPGLLRSAVSREIIRGILSHKSVYIQEKEAAAYYVACRKYANAAEEAITKK